MKTRTLATSLATSLLLLAAPAASAQSLGQISPLNCFSTTGISGCESQPGLDGDLGLGSNAAVSPDGRSLYAMMSLSTLAQFDVRPDGSLAYVTCIGDSSLVENPCPFSAPGIAQGDGGSGPPVVSPDGASVYVAGTTSDAVAVFRRDTDGPTLGRLTSDGCIANTGVTTCDTVPGSTNGQAPGLDNPYDVQVSPDGANVYVVAISSKTVAVFRRDVDGLTKGRLSGDGCIADASADTCDGVEGSTEGRAPGMLVPAAMSISADGSDVYVVDALGAVAVLARATDGPARGRLTSNGCIADSDEDKCDGVEGSTKGRAPGLNNPQEAVISPDGRNVYVGGQAMTAVLKRDESGALTGDGCLATPAFAICDDVDGSTSGRALTANSTALAISADGASVYSADYSGERIGVYARSATGGLTFDGCRAHTGNTSCEGITGSTQGQAPGLQRPSDVVLAPDDGSLYAVSNAPGSVVAFDRFVPAPPPPPPGPPAGPGGGELPAFGGVSLVRATVRLTRAGRGRLALACPQAAQGACEGRAVLRTMKKVRLRAGTKKRRRKLASLAFTAIEPGARVRVRFRVKKAGRRLMRGRRALRARAIVRSHDDRGTDVTIRARVRLLRKRR